ncbi:hypothetical protein D3C71_1671600 [compost metagenome]
MLDTSLCSASVLPNTASIRWTNSTQKWKTYTACARIRPRYSGTCNQRLAKIRAGNGRMGEGLVGVGRDMKNRIWGSQ